MSEDKKIAPVVAPNADVKRQVRQAHQLVREARRALTRLEQKSRIVLIVPRRGNSSARDV